MYAMAISCNQCVGMDALLNSIHDFAQIEIDRLEVEVEKLKREPYNVAIRSNPMEEYSDEQFRRRFRLTKEAVQYLNSLIGDKLEPKKSRENFTITPLQKILITLRYFATACIHQVIGDFIGVSESSVCKIIPIVAEQIAALCPQFIRMPSTDDELTQTKREFFDIAGVPNVIGAIDGILVKIQEVSGAQNKTDLFSRKQFYAINVQIVCDAIIH